MEFEIYDVTEKEGKNGKYLLLDTELGNVFVFENNFNGEYKDVFNLRMKKIDGGVTAGDYQQLKMVDKILGDVVGKRPNQNRIISRIACINSSIKLMAVSGKTLPQITDTKECIFKIADDIFKYVND